MIFFTIIGIGTCVGILGLLLFLASDMIKLKIMSIKDASFNEGRNYHLQYQISTLENILSYNKSKHLKAYSDLLKDNITYSKFSDILNEE